MKALIAQSLAQFQRRLAAAIAQLVEHRLVIRRVDHHRDRLIILGSAAQHRGTADIDLLDRFREFDAGFAIVASNG